ncbi:MAG: ABC transporter permease subunit [Rhodospirillales bacterium]
MTVAPSAASRRRPPPRRRDWNIRGLWHNVGFRNVLAQIIVTGVIIGTAVFMINNALTAMDKRGISTGFDFLWREAGFAIGETPIAFTSSDSFLRAYTVAILNTLRVSVLAIVMATAVGVIIGIARLSSNVIIARLASAYVELFRNTPQLVQIVFWYTLMSMLPHPKQAMSLFDGVFLSNRGLYFPWPGDNPVYGWMLLAFVIACIAAWGIVKWADAQRRKTGRVRPVLMLNLSLMLAAPLLVWIVGGTPTEMSIPALRGFNFRGGASLTPEFLALLLGLSLYIAAFIAEIVRSGIQSIDRGQLEAATSISLSKADTYRRIILPQALRVMVPPATAQYVSTVKNSSLGVAIGYPELFNINNTITTISGNTIEAIGIMMMVYLSIAFSIAIVMNLYNKSVQLKER